MARLALKLLGSYRLMLDGHPIEALESDKARALLAYLAIEQEQSHSREKLVGIFWPEHNEEHARGSLSQALYKLRGVLGDRPIAGTQPAEDNSQTRVPYLLVTPQEIQLNPYSDYETDVAAFLALVAACKAHAHPLYKICNECLERYQEATRLYAGDFLDGFYLTKSMAFEEWATVLRDQLRLKAMAVLDRLVVEFERRGELDQALAYANRMVYLDEMEETGNQHMMRLLALLGRRDEALVQYDSYRQALAIQLGSEPSMESRLLYLRLLNEETGTDSGNLPASLTPFIGRRKELDELWDWVCNPKSRLICIVGLGGCGKTRLALEAARRQRYQFKDGVYFVPLSALGVGSSLLAAIAESLGFTFRDYGDHKRQLLDYLQNKKVLLILDSFETVVGSAGLVAELLSASQESKALVTSRVRLNISGELLFSLGGMSYPPQETTGEISDYSAMELFLEAARWVKLEYAPDDQEGISRICRLVEGMPLSLLLASSWVSDYTAQEIAEQISYSLDFLSVAWVDLPERQRSLRATFEYSWNLLSTDEQQVLMNLAVFRNPFSMQAAVQVAGASPNLMHTLVGKSLLESKAVGRYQMHDLIRHYSAEKLDISPNAQGGMVRQKHSNYFLEQAAGWSKAFKGPQQSVLLIEGDKEIEDVRAAWEWAAQRGDMEKLSLALEGLFLYYFLRYRFLEGEQACQVALEGMEIVPVSGERLNLESWILVWETSFCRLSGKVEFAQQLLDVCRERLGQAEASGENVRQGWAQFWREREEFTNNLSEKMESLRHSATLFEALCDPWWQAKILAWEGEIAMRMGNRILALELHQQAVALSRVAGEPRQLARSLTSLAYYYLIYWEHETGARLMEEAADMYRSVGDLGSQSSAELHLGMSFGWTGRLQEAREMLEMALVKLRQVGDRFYIAYGILGVGVTQMNSGEYDRVALTLQEALQAAQQDGFRREEVFSLAQIGYLTLVQGEPAQALVDLQHSVASFRQMGFAGELGMALAGMALAQHGLVQEQQAWESLQEAMQIAIETHSRFTLFTLPAALVVILTDAGKWEQAVEAYSAVITDPVVANSRWIADMIGNRMELARTQLPLDVFQAAEQRGREGDVFDVLGRLAQEINS